jgi:pyruvate/2-oxoglutarate dehydrogenase complex dihydrolipoamide acyltransferase (E2) component
VKELQVEVAEARLEDAERALDEALDASPEITAPFDGFITKVNVEGGDEVTKGTVAVTLAAPNKFEADTLVSEMDIFQVKLGGEAWVQVDAVQGMSLPAEVTHISPTATIQQGVVNYKVKVELQPLEEARQEAMEKIEQGGFPERLQQAIEEGLITQQQAEEIMKEMQQGQGGQQGQMPKMISEDFQLREGLTVTVSIIVDEREDVLLVPNSAITTQRGQLSNAP